MPPGIGYPKNSKKGAIKRASKRTVKKINAAAKVAPTGKVAGVSIQRKTSNSKLGGTIGYVAKPTTLPKKHKVPLAKAPSKQARISQRKAKKK